MLLLRYIKNCVSKRKLIHFRTIYCTNKFNNAFSTYEPVDLSYASYESSDSFYKDTSIPPLVIMHGLMGSKANWNSICKAVHAKTKPQRKVIAVDARNHGDSAHSDYHTYEHMVADVIKFLENLKIKQVALLGHSMGGRTMMLLALRYPELVERLVVVDISPIKTSSKIKSMQNYFRIMQNVKLDNSLPMSSARRKADIQLSYVIPEPSIRQFILTNLVKQEDGKYSWRINLKVLQKHFENDIVAFPKITDLKYNGPTLFIGGEKSDYLPQSDQSEIVKLFPNATFKYIPNAGHWVHSDKPEDFLREIYNFVNIKT